MSGDFASFGEWMKQRRYQRDLTQAEVAEQAGYSPQYIQRIEANKQAPSRECAERLINLLRDPDEDRDALFRLARARGFFPSDLPSYAQRLPIPLVPLIGRSKELEQVKHYLSRSTIRLITLTGVPGVGKTGLALAIAAEFRDDHTTFKDSVCFVSLRLARTFEHVVGNIVEALGIEQFSTPSLIERLERYLHDKALLLVLDHCEHIRGDVALVVLRLLRAAHGLRVLITSQEPLEEQGEYQIRVNPLAFPSLTPIPPFGRLEEYAAIKLFVEVAQTREADFALRPENAQDIVTICHRLDGIPMLIELAARMDMFSPRSLLEELNSWLKGLDYQSMLDLLYERLDTPEKELFARLSIFDGGCTFDAIKRICATTDDPLTDMWQVLASLCNKNLVQRSQHTAVTEISRYVMLETIHEDALERLKLTGELQALQYAHCTYYLAFAEDGAIGLDGPQPEISLDHLELEQDNMRAALQWALSHHQVLLALRLTNALGRFWEICGYWNEGRKWLEQVIQLDVGDPESTQLQIRAFNALGTLALNQGDYSTARLRFEGSRSLSQAVGDKSSLATALCGLGEIARLQGDVREADLFYQQSRNLFHEIGDRQGEARSVQDSMAELEGDPGRVQARLQQSLELFREQNDKQGIARALQLQGKIARAEGDYVQAHQRFTESLALFQALRNKRGIAWVQHEIGEVLQLQDNDAALAHYQESLQLFQELGARLGVAWSLHNQGYLHVQQDLDYAIRCFVKSLQLFEKLDNHKGIAACLLGLAEVAISRGQAEWAVRWFGLALKFYDLRQKPSVPLQRSAHQRILAVVPTYFDHTTVAALLEEGRSMTIAQVITLSLDLM